MNKIKGLRKPETLDFTGSMRQDLNLRPLRPEAYDTNPASPQGVLKALILGIFVPMLNRITHNNTE